MAEQEVILDESMGSEQLFAAGKELKKLLNKAKRKEAKIEERFVVKIKELKQSNKLIDENEKTIEVLEEEIDIAK